MFDMITNWIAELLNGKIWVWMGISVWNALTESAMNMFHVPIRSFGGGSAWAFVETLLVSMKIVGASLFTCLVYVNFCKKSANLKESMTMEIVFELLIKVLLGQYVILYLDSILNGLIEMMQALISVVAPGGTDAIRLNMLQVYEWDNDSILLGAALGFIFWLVCIAAGIALNLFVYGVFFKIFYYSIVAPLALGTIPGPEGAARTAEGWLKAMICALFEFVGMIIVLKLCAAVINTNGFLMECPASLLAFETAWNIIQYAIMILMSVGVVKGVDTMTRRAFGFG